MKPLFDPMKDVDLDPLLMAIGDLVGQSVADDGILVMETLAQMCGEHLCQLMTKGAAHADVFKIIEVSMKQGCDEVLQVAKNGFNP